MRVGISLCVAAHGPTRNAPRSLIIVRVMLMPWLVSSHACSPGLIWGALSYGGATWPRLRAWSGMARPLILRRSVRCEIKWDRLKVTLIAEIDVDFRCFQGTTFKRDLFECFLVREGIPWPRLPTGQLDLSIDTFRQIARSDSRIAPLRELRSSLSQLRLASLSVGADGRNRALLSAFGASTSRNLPSNSKFIFGPSVWLRALIKPEPGYGISYIDWQSQEFGIAAALSGDTRTMDAYLTGDPYLAFAKQSGAVR